MNFEFTTHGETSQVPHAFHECDGTLPDETFSFCPTSSDRLLVGLCHCQYVLFGEPFTRRFVSLSETEEGFTIWKPKWITLYYGGHRHCHGSMGVWEYGTLQLDGNLILHL